MCNHNKKYETKELFFDFTLGDDSGFSSKIKKNLQENNINNSDSSINEDLNKIIDKNTKFNDKKTIDTDTKNEDNSSYVKTYYDELKTINKLSRSRRKQQKKETFLTDDIILQNSRDDKKDIRFKNTLYGEELSISQKEENDISNRKNDSIVNDNNSAYKSNNISYTSKGNGLSKVQKALLYAQNDLNNKNKENVEKNTLSDNKDLNIENVKKEINNPLNNDFDLKSLLEKIASPKETFLNDINDIETYSDDNEGNYSNKENIIMNNNEDSSALRQPGLKQFSRRLKNNNEITDEQIKKNIYNDTKEHIISLEEDLAKTLEIPITTEKTYKLDLPKIENDFSYDSKKKENYSNQYTKEINRIQNRAQKQKNNTDIIDNIENNNNLIIDEKKSNTRYSRRNLNKNKKKKVSLFQTPLIIILLIIVVLSIVLFSFIYIMNNRKSNYNPYEYNVESKY